MSPSIHPTKRVALVIDDMAAERMHLRVLLEYMGFDVVEAGNAESALRIMDRYSPCVITMDVVMPGVNGFAATRRLKSNAATRLVPIIIVTSKDRPADHANAAHSGACELVPKPATKRTLGWALIRAGVLAMPDARATSPQPSDPSRRAV